VGGYFGYNISGKDKSVITLNGSDQPNSGFVKSDYKEVYNNIDAGVRLGAGTSGVCRQKIEKVV
jgi:hypothetical protein